MSTYTFTTTAAQELEILCDYPLSFLPDGTVRQFLFHGDGGHVLTTRDVTREGVVYELEF